MLFHLGLLQASVVLRGVWISQGRDVEVFSGARILQQHRISICHAGLREARA